MMYSIKYLQTKYPESFDPLVPEELVYTGPFSLTDSTEVEGVNTGQMVLAPTRTYAPIINTTLKEFRPKINGIVHCSGGGQTKVLNFIDKLHVIKDNLFDTPPLFRLIQQASGTDWSEMYKVFNMGHRMEIYTDEVTAKAILSISASYAVDARIVGRVEASDNKKLTVSGKMGKYLY